MIDFRDYKNLIYKVVAFCCNLIITFFVSSFVINTVGQEAYGFVGLGNDFLSYVQIITVAINSMASRYITIEYERGNMQSANEYYSSLFIANAFIAAVISFIGIFTIQNIELIVNISSGLISDVKILWFFLLVNFMVALVGSVFGTATFCKKRLDLVALRTTIGCILKAVILVLCYYFFKPYIFYIGMATLISTIYAVLYDYKYSRQLMPEVSVKMTDFRIAKIFELIKSGCWNSLTKVGTILSSGLDLMVTNQFVGAGYMGIISIAKTIPTQIYTLVSTAASAFSPSFIIGYAKNDFNDMIHDLKMTFRIFSAFTVVSVVLMISISNKIFTLWTPSLDIQSLYAITVVISIGYLAVMPFESIWSIYTATNKIKGSSIYLICESFLNIALELFFIQFVDNYLAKMLIIVGVTSALQIIRALVFFPLYTKKCIGRSFNFIYGFFIKNAFIVAALSLIGLFINSLFQESNWPNLILCTCIIGGISVVVCYVIVLNKDDRKQIRYFIEKRRK